MSTTKSWEDLVARARAQNAEKAKAVSNSDTGNLATTKSWDDLVARARKQNAEKRQKEQQELMQSDAYKWASANAKRLKNGLNLNINNGQIYTFEPLTADVLQSSIDVVDSEIEKLKAQGVSSNMVWNMFTGVANNSDAAEKMRELEKQKAVYSAYLKNVEYADAMAEIDKNGDSELFSELYSIDSRKKTLLDALGNIGSGGNLLPTNNADDLTREAEIKTALQEKYGDNFEKYRDIYAQGKNDKIKSQLVQKMQETVDEHPFLGTVGYTLSNVATAPVRGIAALSDSINKAAGNYGATSGSVFQEVSDATVQKVNEEINNKFENQYAADFVRTLYNAAVSLAESKLTMGTFGKLAESVLGLNAATSTYKSAKERGLSDGQALANGIAAGIFETLFEHFSLDQVRIFKALPSTSLKPFIQNVLKQAVVEGGEEVATDLANEAYDYLVNGGLSQYEQALQNGMTAGEYAKQFISQLGETFFTGALSGGGMIGVSAAPNAVRGSMINALEDVQQGQQISRFKNLHNDVLSDAKESGSVLRKKAEKAEKRIADGKGISYRKLGEINRKVIKKQRESDIDKILSSKDYKELSGKEKNALRSSVLTHLNDAKIVSPEQQDVLNTENAKQILKEMQSLEYRRMEERDNKRIAETEKQSEIQKKTIEKIRTAVAEKNTESLVKNTFTAKHKDGYEVNIGAVKNISNGELEIVQDNETGATAKLSELNIKDSQARELYSNLQTLATGENPLTVEAINVALSMYNTLDNTSARAYALWVHDAYKAGALNMKNTVLSFSEFEEMFRNKYEADITEAQLREIYEVGARNLVTKPGVTRIGHKGLSKFQAEQVFILSERAKKLGLELVLTDGRLTDDDGKGVNALYIEGTNRIVMSLQNDLGLTLVHAGHEIFHYAKNQSAEMAQNLQDTVINLLKSDSKYDFDGIYKQVSAEYDGLSENAILEEIAAQYLGVVFASEDNIRKTVATATTEQKRFLKRMVKYLKDFVKSLKELIKIYGDSDKTVRAAVETPVEQLQDIADKFDKVLKETAEKKKSAEQVQGGEKYSKQTTKNTKEQPSLKEIKKIQALGKISINDFSSKELADAEYWARKYWDKYKVKSPFFRAWFGDWREYDKNNFVEVVSFESNERTEISKTHREVYSAELRHNITVDDTIVEDSKHYAGKNKDKKQTEKLLGRIDEILEKGIWLDSRASARSSGNKKGSTQFMHYLYTPISINGAPFMAKLTVEEYDVDGKMRAYNLRRITMSNLSRAQFSELILQNREKYAYKSDVLSVAQLFELVKKYDAEFKSNPVNTAFLNEDGTPKVFYHGTKTDFTVFDRSQSNKKVHLDVMGAGNYFTDRKQGAERYGGNIIEAYLRIKNPYIFRNTEFNVVADQIANDFGIERDGLKGSQVQQFLKEKGYDGVVLEEDGKAVMVNVFDSEQIKSATDNIGTFDMTKKDIRYSKSISEKTEVKEKYSRQLINDSWEDIRTKMYENEVHEDIIEEIESYVQGIANRKLARETAVTEGLIPKYEAILKITRKYTKGSEVSANELADTINELMWAAHDGNLDTKQFIASVKLFAEDILRTGKKVNDEMYRKYADFRKLTRETSVFVDKNVYNHYLSEYGSQKNLNRACAGKIKIKPYEDGNSTGRSLDNFYSELKERFPELMYAESDVYHQLFDILDAWQAIQPWTEYYSDTFNIRTKGDLHHQALVMSEDILSEVLGIKETVKTIADKYSDNLKNQQEHYKEYYRKQAEEGRRKRREREEVAVIKKRILRNTNRLSDMLRNETDQRHIPEDFKKTVMDFLNIFIFKNEAGRDVYHIKNGTLSMVKLGNAYASYYNPIGEEGREMTQYDKDVARWIEELAFAFGEDIDIKTLSLENLQKVDNIVTHFCHIIKHENEMFVNGKREKFTDWANTSISEMWQHIKKPEYKTEKKILDAEHGMLTPIYFFKTIGTSTVNGVMQEEKLFKMFRDLQDGQDKWYRNIADVKKQLAEIKEKYHYSKDWKKDTTEFTLSSGETIKLTAEEIMYMRALNIRETGHINRLCHLLEGGIIVENDGRLRKFAEKKQGFEETMQARKDHKEKGGFSEQDIKDALKKNLTQADLISIFATLTEEQERYSEALVNILSTTGAELGNEVSKELFGIKKFTEKNYIPISVAESFLQFSVDKKAGGNIRLKNRSFTKRTTQNANATVYVRSITDIAVEHMQEMSLYNAMTIPIENFTRVFNYQKPVQEKFTSEGTLQKNTGNSYKEIFEAVYGERGIKYFEDFIKDMNGGNQMQSRDFMSKMMGLFKKSAVTGSLSVAIQQPSAIVRATALIDPKYFVTKVYSNEDYLEMMEYCPVAGIKEIGRFDTGLGLTATEWILDENGALRKKADDFLSFLPGWMDRRTWVYIWEAVKKETADKTKLKGEELLTEAAKRFRDVIDYTQVYDSTLSRSAYMRDKGTGAKMATAFLSEPTLSYNMVRDGLLNAKNNKKQAARSVAAFAGATLLNAMLKTLVTALRHDDEETNYFEVYLSEMPQNFFEDLIIVNSLPVVKDIISIFKGYDVNRSDMTLFSNVYNAFKVISKEDHIPTWDEWFALFGALSAFTGIPLNNVLKDFTAVVKTVIGLGKAPEFSWDVLGQTITEAFIGEADDAVKIYRAILNGNKEITDRYLLVDEKKVQEYIKQGYSEADALNKVMDNTESNFHSKVVNGLVSEDIRIKEAAEARLESDTEVYEELLEELTELGFDRDDVIKAVDKYIASMEDKTYESSEKKDKPTYTYDDLYRAIDSRNMTAAKVIFDSLTEEKEIDTVRDNIKKEYADDIYNAIRKKNNAEKQRLINMFDAFDYDYHYAVILGLQENDNRVKEAAEARYTGKYSLYESKSAEIINDGFSENDVYSAIEKETAKLAPEEDDSNVSSPETNYQYEYSDIHKAIDKNDLAGVEYVVAELKESGVKADNIKSSLKGKYRDKYIKAWQTGDDDTIQRLRTLLTACDVGFTNKTFAAWEKAANEK